jgi:DNA-binding transcriptional LysR family regulator
MLDVRRMRVLREVAARGSFSAAADALAYTQSAVSQQIAALEREAGTTLVERNARGVRLTDAGRALVEHADAILARLSDAEAELEAIAGLRGGRLRLAAFPSAGASIMPEAIARFRERHPAVDLTLEPAEPGPALNRLRGDTRTRCPRAARTASITRPAIAKRAPAPSSGGMSSTITRMAT